MGRYRAIIAFSAALRLIEALVVLNMHAKRQAFKYRSGDPGTLARDIESLHNATFYAAARHTLNDPFEGRFDRASLDQQFSLLEALVSRSSPTTLASLGDVSNAAEKVLEFVDTSGVFSLSYNPLQELIWAHYGGSHRGYCIGYDIQKLVEFEPNIHHFVDVQYSNTAPSLKPEDILGGNSPINVLRKMLGVKSNPWAYEEEVRVITVPVGPHEHDFRAVKTVYFGLRCPDTTKVAVMEALAGRGVTYEQVTSPPASYALKSVPIADQYASAPTFKENLAPIIDGAICPEYLKPEQKQYATYLVKAAEIVRREPYCKEIQLVEFSSSRSKPGEPVIFVQYLRAPNKWVNHYLALAEIDKEHAALRLPKR
jgi:Protein of unknown function (DUF2971)